MTQPDNEEDRMRKLWEAIHEEVTAYERREHELAWGIEIDDPEIQAEHQAIKAFCAAGESLGQAIISWHVERNNRERRPIGAFRADGVIPLSETRRIEMRWATREHLVQWRVIETDPRNLAYIDDIDALWEKCPQYKTLDELMASPEAVELRKRYWSDEARKREEL